jgi:hypothetical protein
LPEKDRGDRGERFEFGHAEQALKDRAEHEHDPAHHSDVIEDRNERGNENDNGQHADRENESVRSKQLKHLRLSKAAEEKRYAGIAVIKYAIHGGGHISQYRFAERHEKN